jgi:type VI secretion system protein ImpA
MDRQSALATLLDIAGYFDRTEPQSLVGNGLRDLVRRANLSMDDLMAELLPDGDQRAMFFLRAGIAPPKRSGGGGGGFDDGITFS